MHDLSNPFGWKPSDRAALTDHATVSLTDLVNVSEHDRARIERTAAEHNAGTAERVLQLLTSLRNKPSPYQIDGYQHCLQTATRALRNGAGEEQIVCALMHDVATCISTENHAAVAAEILRPYISRASYWTVAHHGEFLLYLRNSDKGSRAKYDGHPFAPQTEHFCTEWDQKSFDPKYDTLAIDAFVPDL